MCKSATHYQQFFRGKCFYELRQIRKGRFCFCPGFFRTSSTSFSSSLQEAEKVELKKGEKLLGFVFDQVVCILELFFKTYLGERSHFFDLFKDI